jgi:hypothetical protein
MAFKLASRQVANVVSGKGAGGKGWLRGLVTRFVKFIFGGATGPTLDP